MYSLLKIMLAKIKSLLNYAYKINLLIFDGHTTLPENRLEEIKQMNYYLQAKIHNYYVNIITNQKRIVH